MLLSHRLHGSEIKQPNLRDIRQTKSCNCHCQFIPILRKETKLGH